MTIEELFKRLFALNNHEDHMDFVIVDPEARSRKRGYNDGDRCGVCFVLEHVESWRKLHAEGAEENHDK